MPRRRSPPACPSLAASLLAAARPAAAGGCRLPIQRGRWNVVVVLVDTLRADHLGAYGYERPTSPQLRRSGGGELPVHRTRGRRPRARFPSVNSLLTSRYPARFLGQPDGAVGIPAGVPIARRDPRRARAGRPRRCRRARWCARRPTRFNPGGGFDRGFGALRRGRACGATPPASPTARSPRVGAPARAVLPLPALPRPARPVRPAAAVPQAASRLGRTLAALGAPRRPQPARATARRAAPRGRLGAARRALPAGPLRRRDRFLRLASSASSSSSCGSAAARAHHPGGALRPRRVVPRARQRHATAAASTKPSSRRRCWCGCRGSVTASGWPAWWKTSTSCRRSSTCSGCPSKGRASRAARCCRA